MGASLTPRAAARAAISGEGDFEVLVDVVAEGLERRDVEDLGFVGQRAGLARAAARESMALRKAARVLPEPVGAEISTSRPWRISGQPRRWGSVGAPKVAANHWETRGWKEESTYLYYVAARLDVQGRERRLGGDDGRGHAGTSGVGPGDARGMWRGHGDRGPGAGYRRHIKSERNGSRTPLSRRRNPNGMEQNFENSAGGAAVEGTLCL